MNKPDAGRQAQILRELRREEELRWAGYRERALKLFPHVCARCARDFAGKKLRELTVHHRDHNHNNNPIDGSNWELLCLYCHDHEHTRGIQEKREKGGPANGAKPDPLSHTPFTDLQDRLKRGD